MSKKSKTSWKQKTAILAVSLGVTLGGVLPVKNAIAGCCGETAVLMAILSAMEVNFELLYTYMISGVGDVGTGIVGTISGNARAKMSHDEIQGANQAAYTAALERSRDAEMIAANTLNKEIGDPRSCQEDQILASHGVRGANVDAAVVSSRAAAASNKKAAEHLAGTQPSDAAHAGVIINEQKEFASPADVKAGRAQALGSKGMPDANVRVQSLFTPAHDYTDPAAAAKQSVTFNDDQVAAAQLAIDNIAARFSPPALPQGVEATPAGLLYIAKTKIFNARLSPAIMGLSGISSRRAPADLGNNAAQWATASSEYAALFPGVSKPDRPSELELLRLEVMRRYAGSQWIADLKKSGSPAQVAVEQAVTDSVKLKVLYEIHTRLEENSAIQSAILAQLVNPVSRVEMEGAAQSAYRNKQ